MAETAKGFAEALRYVISKAARETMESEIAHLIAYSQNAPLGIPDKQQRAEAKRRVDNLDDEQVMQYLEATMPEPCPTCGHA